MKISIPTWLRFSVAGLLCLIAAYLTEPTLGAVAALPFIIVFTAIAYLVYRRVLPLVGLSALGAFVFKAAIASELSEIRRFTVFCTIFSLASIFAVKLPVLCKKLSKGAHIGTSAVIIVLLIVIYSIFSGTFFGNITSKEVNENFIADNYPDTEFTIGSTFYSFGDKCYLTEAIFRDKEVYSARFSAHPDGSAKIDGYRDYCEARLLEYGTVTLKNYLSSHAHEGEDFALRRDRIDTDGKLTAKSEPEDYYGRMCYEIAFYDVFADADEFENMCREYIGYIPEVFGYSEITFFGFGEGDDFEYSLVYSRELDKYTVLPFDSEEFARYREDNDTHRYWTVIK